MGAVGRKVKTNDLWLLPRYMSLFHTIPMKIWVTTDGVLHANTNITK
jgi:hypothetical protein